MRKRVAVAMSGGVDSSVAAALLVQKGYAVEGVTMCLKLPEPAGGRPACCGMQGINDARRVCMSLGIRHHVIGLEEVFKKKVIDDFCREYASGRTPNPCIRCNQFVKFDALLKKAVGMGAEYLATGHYARLARSCGSLYLKKAVDPAKDQSYFLYRLTRAQLRRIIFPVGAFEKKEVRAMAKAFGLDVAAKSDSQEICFLPGNDYRDFLSSRLRLVPGRIIDQSGKVLGAHKGLALYTVGQRQGLGIAWKFPLYVTRIDAASNSITVGPREEALERRCTVRQAHFVSGAPKKKVVLKVKIRYNHRESPAEVAVSPGRVGIVFKKPQFAITPGQSAVFYRGSLVIGGGIIDEVGV